MLMTMVKLIFVKSMNVSLKEKMNGEMNNVDQMVMSIVQLQLNVLNVQMLGIVMISKTKLLMSLLPMMKMVMDKSI